MNETAGILVAIKRRSDFLTRGEKNWKNDEWNLWRKRLASAKNYICTPNLKYWTFGKSADLNMGYHANGGDAKLWLKARGFINVMNQKETIVKKRIVKSFLTWAGQVEPFDIQAKFHKDQRNNKRFELLIHESVLSKKERQQMSLAREVQLSYDEGFRQYIVKEVLSRDSKVRELAKRKHGTTCIVCEFNFGDTYGVHGDGFIEMHHLNPIKNGKRETTVNDLQPVCANCHRMLHRGNVCLSIEEIQGMLTK